MKNTISEYRPVSILRKIHGIPLDKGDVPGKVGDPYEEFYKLESFGTEVSIPYCIGQIDAYFNDSVPMDFWIANAVYVAQASLYSIKWAEKS